MSRLFSRLPIDAYLLALIGMVILAALLPGVQQIEALASLTASEHGLAFHGVDRIYPGTSTLLKNGGRINLTLRRVNS